MSHGKEIVSLTKNPDKYNCLSGFLYINKSIFNWNACNNHWTNILVKMGQQGNVSQPSINLNSALKSIGFEM